MSYTTVSDVKMYLGIGTASDDALLSSLISAAQSFIDAYTNRRFEPVVATIEHSRTDVLEDTLWLRDDLVTLNSVTLNGVAVDLSDIRSLGGNVGGQYHALVSERFTNLAVRDIIQVTGQWGYSASIPQDIVHACTRLAAYYYRQRDAQIFDVTLMSDVGQMTLPRGLPQDVKQILDRYRRLICSRVSLHQSLIDCAAYQVCMFMRFRPRV